MADKDDDLAKVPEVSQEEEVAMMHSLRARHPLLYQFTRLLNSHDRLYRLQDSNGPEQTIEDEMRIREEILNDFVKDFPKRKLATGAKFVLEDIIEQLQDEIDQPDPASRLS
jgi:hypothetical protein